MKAKAHQNSDFYQKVIMYAEQIFQDKEEARSWLSRVNGALGDKKPIDLMDTEKGCNQVLEILGQIENQIYS
jgi:putative toxin-antitoxin system antitoxin component (TIGR02293 family)